MNKGSAKAFKQVIKEFEEIRDSLKPVLKEVKKFKGIQVEFKHFKEETSAQLRKQDFELKRIGKSAKHAIQERGLYELRMGLNKIAKELDDFKKGRITNTDLQKISKTDDASISRLKSELKKINDKQDGLIKITSNRVADLITDIERIDKRIDRSAKVWESESKIRSRHFGQVVDEINVHKKESYSLTKTVAGLDKTVNSLKSNLTSSNKKQTIDSKQIKTRIQELEKTLASKTDLNRLHEKLSVDLSLMGKKVLDMEKRSSGNFDINAKQTELEMGLSTKINKIGAGLAKLEIDLDGLKKELVGIDLKVENTSKLLKDMEKVL